MVDISYNEVIPAVNAANTRKKPRYGAELAAIYQGRESGATNVKFSCESLEEAKNLCSAMHAYRRKGEFRGIIARRGTDYLWSWGQTYDAISAD